MPMKQFKLFISGASILLLVIAGIVALSGRTNMLGGYHIYSVLTGSMEPTIPVESLLLVQKIDPSTIAVNDVITFEKPGSKGVLVTHRVAAIERSDENSITFKTKGDANPIPDSWIVTLNQVKGTVRYHLPKIGALVTFLNTKLGILLFVLLPVILLAYEDIYTIHKTLFEWQLDRKLKTNKSDV
jgi:signal peptidase